MLMNAFWDAYPAMKMLKENLEAVYKKEGHLVGLDGRVFKVREERKLLNQLLQGNAAIVFKKWMEKIHLWKYADGMQHKMFQLLGYHDELLHEVIGTEMQTALVGSKIVHLAEVTGEELGINVKIGAEYKVGKTYADCH